MRTPLIALAVVLPVSAAIADPVPNPVDRLIAQLGSPDFRAREAASKELEALGGPALPAVARAAKSSADAEIARRATEVAAKIARRIDNDKTLAPTLVELDFTDVPLATVQAELQKQLGKPLTFNNPVSQKKVTVKTGGKVPFWEAMAKVCDAAGLEVAAGAPITVAASSRPLNTVDAARDAMFAQQQARIAKQQAELREKIKAQKEVAGNADDLKKRMAQLEQQKLQMERLMAVMVQQQALQRAAARSRRQPIAIPSPHNSGQIALRAKSELPNPSCVSGAVRIEAVPFPEASRATVARDTVPVILHVSPEPKLQWQRVEAVRVNKAIDDAGRELAVAIGDAEIVVGQVIPIQGGAAVFGGNGQLQLVPSRRSGQWQSYTPTATQAVVRLKAGDDAPKALKSLEGVIRGVVRTGEEELVAIAGLDQKPNAAAPGANGLGMAITMTARADDNTHVIEATLRYNPAEVQVNGQPQQEVTVVNQARGRVIIRQNRGGFVSNRPSSDTFGLTLMDADGKPFTLELSSSRRTFDRTGGEVTDIITMTARPAGKDQGAPAKVTLRGTRLKTVEVPFKLTDLPVKAGTAPVPDESKE